MCRRRARRDRRPCPWPGRWPRRWRPRPCAGWAALRAVCRVAPSAGSSCSSARSWPRHATTARSRCRPADPPGSPPVRRAGFFQRLPLPLILGLGARAGRELGQTQGAQRPSDRCLIDLDPDLFEEPAREVLAPHPAMDGRDRTALHDPGESLALLLVQLGGMAGALPLRSPAGPCVVKRSPPSRTIGKVTPPIRAASVREPPSSISASVRSGGPVQHPWSA